MFATSWLLKYRCSKVTPAMIKAADGFEPEALGPSWGQFGVQGPVPQDYSASAQNLSPQSLNPEAADSRLVLSLRFGAHAAVLTEHRPF